MIKLKYSALIMPDLEDIEAGLLFTFVFHHIILSCEDNFLLFSEIHRLDGRKHCISLSGFDLDEKHVIIIFGYDIYLTVTAVIVTLSGKAQLFKVILGKILAEITCCSFFRCHIIHRESF